MSKTKFVKGSSYQAKSLLSTEQDQLAFIRKINKRVSRLVGEMDELTIPDFGSSLFDSSGHYCVFHNHDTLVASTIADRISNKFEKPNLESANILRDQCNKDWISFEQELGASKLSSTTGEQRGDLYRGRDQIASILGSPKGFLRLVSEMEIDLGPGEQFLSNQGDVSLFTKLNNISMWSVTKDCAPFAALVIASNKGFRTILNEKFFKPMKYKANSKKIHVQLDTFKGYPKKVAYFAERVLSEFFYSDYGHKHLLQEGARGTSVYKNSKTRRFINIECLWNVICQQLIGKAIRHRLKVSGNDLQFRQDIHKSLIKQSFNSTVDWRSASDSNRTDRLRILLHPLIFQLMDAVRSHFVMITHQENGQFFKAYHPIEKFSSMGNGFTFELLTLTILGMSRAHDEKASVYGDDLIVTNQCVDRVVKSVEAAGFSLNPKKSFIKKPLRESCGGFYLDGYGVITCFDIKWCVNIADTFITINKFSRILLCNPNWEHPLKDLIRETRDDLLSMVNPCFMGPPSYLNDIPAWVEVDNARNRQMRSVSCKRFRKERVIAGKLAENWCYANTSCITLTPELPKSIKIKGVRGSDVKSTALIYAYLKDCTVSDMMFRVHKTFTKVKWVKTIITEDGCGIRAATARVITQD